MDDVQNSSFIDLITSIVGGTASGLCERAGETKERQPARVMAIIRMVMSLLPRDAMEAMLASHCVMFHELMVDSARDTLRGEVETARKATRSSIVAMDKCFRANLAELERYQKRNAQGSRDAPAKRQAERRPAEAPPDAAPVAAAAAMPASDIACAPAAVRTNSRLARTPENMAAYMGNNTVMDAMNAGDAAAFARALGVEPTEEFLAAAAQPGSPFDPAFVPGD